MLTVNYEFRAVSRTDRVRARLNTRLNQPDSRAKSGEDQEERVET